jgi:hypothetical protein
MVREAKNTVILSIMICVASYIWNERVESLPESRRIARTSEALSWVTSPK